MLVALIAVSVLILLVAMVIYFMMRKSTIQTPVTVLQPTIQTPVTLPQPQEIVQQPTIQTLVTLPQLQEIIQQPICDKSACNAIMQDWIVNRYWGFSDSTASFNECKNCQARWFRAPMDVSTDGVNYTNTPDRASAFNLAQV